MAYSRREPPPELAPFVDSISFQEDGRPAPASGWAPTRVLPTGRIDLILNLADPFELQQGEHRELVPDSSLIGQWTRPVDVQATGRTGMIIVSFHCWGAASFFPVVLAQLNNQPLDLNDLWGRSRVEALREQLWSARQQEQQLRIIQEVLKSTLIQEPDPLVVWSAHEMNRSLGTIEVDFLAERAGVSRRTLLRRFKKSAGIRPKLFASIVRFQKALFLLRSGHHWNDIADYCNFYDQPHLIRELRRFSGQRPSWIRQCHSRTPLQNYFNSGRSLSHFYNTVYL